MSACPAIVSVLLVFVAIWIAPIVWVVVAVKRLEKERDE